MSARFTLLFALAACTNDVPGSATFDTSLPAPPTVAPPTVACTEPDAGSYTACTLPPSVCADDHWAAYFDDGVCVNGTCELVTKYHYCEQGCRDGACISNGPTAASRGF